MTKINCLVDHRGAPCTCDLSMYENLNKPMTKNSETHTDWDKRFDKRFPLEGGIWVLERHRNEVRNFIAKELADARREVIKEIEEKVMECKKDIIKYQNTTDILHKTITKHERAWINGGFRLALESLDKLQKFVILATLREEEK